MTGKILSYLKRMRSLLPQKLNRYHWIAVFAGFLTIGFFSFTQPVGAGSGLMGNIADGMLHFFTWLMLIVADLCIGLTIFFLRFFISIAAYNNYIDVDVVQLGWIMIRDVANMFFVVALLVIAFGTILGIEEYEWKKNLVKLILAAILINFSNLIAQLIIDVAHVFTITFLNAVAATAGGNIINMFKLGEITQMVGAVGADAGDVRAEMAAGAVAATGFAVLAAVAMGSYAYVMMVRVVVLWGLIILAPGAYILGVLPKTKAYADRWWSEFGKHVVVAPVMVFFLWLSFATLGNGQIANDIQARQGEQFQLNQAKSGNPSLVRVEDPRLSLSKVTTWENMASFFIAMAFMYYGLKVTQETGATGAGAVAGALDFGKKVATIATGYAAGRWLAGAAQSGVTGLKNVALKTAKGAAYYAPLIGGEKIVRKAKNEWAGLIAWYRDTGFRPRMEMGDDGRMKPVYKELKDEHGKTVHDEITGKPKMIMDMYEGKRGTIQKMANWFSRKDTEGRKKLEKTEKFSELISEIQSKRTTGLPKYWLQPDDFKADAIDRMYTGILEGESARSEGKTKEYKAAGKLAVMGNVRFKDGKLQLVNEKTGKPNQTIAQMTAQHLMMGEIHETSSHIQEERAKDVLVHAGTHEAQKVIAEVKRLEDSIKPENLLAAESELEAAKAQALALDTGRKQEINDSLETISKGRIAGRTPLNTDFDKTGDAMTELENSKEYKDYRNSPEYQEKGEALKELVADYQKAISSGDKVKQKELHDKIEIAQDGMLFDKKYTKKDGTIGEDTEKELLSARENAAKALKSYDEGTQEQMKGKTEAISAVYKPKMDALEIEKKRKTVEDIQEDLKKDENYTAAKKKVSEKVATMEQAAIMKSPALRLAAVKEMAAAAKEETEEAEKNLQLEALGLKAVKVFFDEQQSRKIGADAADQFIASIKEKSVANVFTKGMDVWNKKVKDVLASGTKNLKDIKLETTPETAGARLALAEVLADYSKDIATVEKKKVTDETASAFTMEHYGFRTPKTAFNDWVKKRMEAFQGVEREQAVKIAIGSLGKLITIKEKGGVLSSDQEAQMMANAKYLTTQAWSDDLLARITDVIERSNKGMLSGGERDEAEMLRKVFVDQLHWGKVRDDGKIDIEHRSGHDRTNDLHRLSAYGGDVKLLQAENAVLRHQKTTGLGYEKSVSDLAKLIEENGVVGKVNNLAEIKKTGDKTKIAGAEKELREFAKQFGIEGDTAIEELSAFASSFSTVGSKIEGANLDQKISASANAFVSNIKKFEEANEILTDFKTLANNTGHIDDGGHTIYDMDTGYARGMLADDALRFVLSDWRKKNLDTRMGGLKSHSILYMGEKSGTAYMNARHVDAMRETFQGLQSSLSWKRLDGRVVDHLAGLAAGELAKKDELSNRMIIGHADSEFVKEEKEKVKDDHSTDQIDALEHFANNQLVALKANPLVALAALGERAGLKFEESAAGKMNITIENNTVDGQQVNISTAEQFVAWVKKHASSSLQKEINLSDMAVMKAFESQRRFMNEAMGGGKTETKKKELPAGGGIDIRTAGEGEGEDPE